MTAHIDDELIDIARMYADGETVSATTRLRFVDLIAEWDARQVGASTRQGLGADGLALVDELADIASASLDLSLGDDDEGDAAARDVLARYRAWHEQSAAANALPGLGLFCCNHLLRCRVQIGDGVGLDEVLEGLDAEVHEGGMTGRERDVVAAHLRADARATTGDDS